jgi:hypothetical protein
VLHFTAFESEASEPVSRHSASTSYCKNSWIASRINNFNGSSGSSRTGRADEGTKAEEGRKGEREREREKATLIHLDRLPAFSLIKRGSEAVKTTLWFMKLMLAATYSVHWTPAVSSSSRAISIASAALLGLKISFAVCQSTQADACYFRFGSAKT